MKSAIINRRMARVLLIAILMMVCTNSVQAQQTTLTVDCQTPGWLSSKIGYKDQQSVKYLTVTGYLNLTDMSFLAGLTKNSLVHLDIIKRSCKTKAPLPRLSLPRACIY